MEINDLKVKLGEAGVAYAGKSDEDIIRLGLTNSIIAADDDLAKSLGSGATKVGNTFADFMKSRETVSLKIQIKEGEKGKNPFLTKESVVLCTAMGKSEKHVAASKRTYYRTKLKHAQYGTVNVNSDSPLTEGAQYKVVCRILKPGIYMDAGADGVQRELHVPEGRAGFLYNPQYDPMRVTVDSIAIESALKGNTGEL